MSTFRFDWDQKLDVGVSEMNREHQYLIGIMNRLAERIHSGAKRDEVLQLLEQLANYTVQHFSDEERYMEEINFAGVTTHKIIHRRLLESLNQSLGDFRSSGEDTLPDSFFNFLRTWLVAHIQGIDKKYSPSSSRRAA